MPTGYTAAIEDGEITTGKDFLMQCSRNFGAMMHMREEPMGAKIEKRIPSDYYDKQLKESKEKLDFYCQMTDEEIQVEIEIEFKKAIESNKKYYESGLSKNKAYAKVLAEVLQWSPPTDDHVNLKEFAIQQIEMCMDDHHIKYKDLIPEKLSIQEWHAAKIEGCLENMKYYSKSKKQEEDRCKETNKWIVLLVKSLTE
jgi:hypothetical protein